MSSPALASEEDWVLVEGVGSPVAAACHLVSGSGGGRGAPGGVRMAGSQRWLHGVPGEGGGGWHWLPQPQGEGAWVVDAGQGRGPLSGGGGLQGRVSVSARLL